ncbi:Zinc finger CW-type PWWP domain protein 1 like protein [Argiope bruennichi]|uniref:Zinc finger CW-type PWWP domain protein 1 like protein n=1 Tax=Argiope bruennichi TaxID=94029 RepID=A0A8T0E117_ARGBR|nr:Zinc finger CW-type PWWP domain protein 1 like protein [Argiope bruennichi]
MNSQRMTDGDKGEIGNCANPSKSIEVEFAERGYPPGTLVWAKIAGFPWWPGMIEDSPDSQQFFVVNEKGEVKYHVNFFGEKPKRSWINVSKIKEFHSPAVKTPNKPSKHSPTLKKSIEQAEEASKLPIKERLEKYKFAVRYIEQLEKIKDKSKKSCSNNKNQPDARYHCQTRILRIRKRARESNEETEDGSEWMVEKANHRSACQSEVEEKYNKTEEESACGNDQQLSVNHRVAGCVLAVIRSTGRKGHQRYKKGRLNRSSNTETVDNINGNDGAQPEGDGASHRRYKKGRLNRSSNTETVDNNNGNDGAQPEGDGASADVEEVHVDETRNPSVPEPSLADVDVITLSDSSEEVPTHAQVYEEYMRKKFPSFVEKSMCDLHKDTN